MTRASITPRLLRAPDAARYLGLSESKFRELVSDGRIAKPKPQDHCVTWDIRDLDDYADALPRDGERATLREVNSL